MGVWYYLALRVQVRCAPEGLARRLVTSGAFSAGELESVIALPQCAALTWMGRMRACMHRRALRTLASTLIKQKICLSYNIKMLAHRSGVFRHSDLKSPCRPTPAPNTSQPVAGESSRSSPCHASPAQGCLRELGEAAVIIQQKPNCM